ncbi:hypothetical protein SASPL_134577 [Salvia splendens]|uniref:Xylem cysteine proteinase n=1 Tax=Salvia splendens TaxID=180675 RepID=A0A8X8WY29_SALSN|nr:hypothetical protein SASPL_134577 [Salvia splendens]
MSLSLYSKLVILAAFALFYTGTAAYARELSIVGYEPEDLTCIDKLINLFESWVDKHGKMYKTLEEKLHRFEIFKDNLKHIDERNKVVSNYWLGLNEFSDLSHDEFKKMFLGLKSDQIPKRGENFKYRDFVDVPKFVDWRKKGAVTRIKNQGQCVEGINQIVTGNLTELSEQELIDCDTAYNNGCNGGLMDYAFSFIVSSKGLHKEDDYPYLMEEGTCQESRDEAEVVTIDGYHDVKSFLKALANQPLSVAIDASGRDFQFYNGGVFDGHCGTDLDHGVAAVGYGTSKGLDYVIVKNSWGPSKMGGERFYKNEEKQWEARGDVWYQQNGLLSNQKHISRLNYTRSAVVVRCCFTFLIIF